MEAGKAPGTAGRETSGVTSTLEDTQYSVLQRLILLLHGGLSLDQIEDAELRRYVQSTSFLDTSDDRFLGKLRFVADIRNV